MEQKRMKLSIYFFLCFIGGFLLKVHAQMPVPDVNELVSAEYNMSVLAANKGLFTAFMAYSDENTVLFVPSAVKAIDYLDNKPKLPDLMRWKPTYAKIAKSNEWGFTTGPINWQNIGDTKKYGEYLSIWKRDRKGVWKIAFRANTEHDKPGNLPAETQFENPHDGNFQKLRSKARIKQREDIVASTDQLFATILKADNRTAFKEFLTADARIYLPNYLPITKLDRIIPFLEEKQIVIESEYKEVNRAYSGELAYSSGQATIHIGLDIINCAYMRIWELQDDKTWKVSVDMYIKQ